MDSKDNTIWANPPGVQDW